MPIRQVNIGEIAQVGISRRKSKVGDIEINASADGLISDQTVRSDSSAGPGIGPEGER